MNSSQESLDSLSMPDMRGILAQAQGTVTIEHSTNPVSLPQILRICLTTVEMNYWDCHSYKC